MENARRFTPFFMIFILLALLAALWAGLLRLGWPWPVLRPSLPALHGPLMVSGFLGTLIGLERAVALGKGWTYLSPLLTGAGGLLLIAGFSPTGTLLITAGSALLLAVSTVMVRREPAMHTVIIGAGALVWFGGNLLWFAGWPIYRASYWWAGFLVLVIAGERLELSRVLRLSKNKRALFGLAAGMFGAGLVLSLLAYAPGVRLASLGALALAVWLGAYDIARRTIRKPGVTRYIAFNLLVGYAWLAISGLIGLYYGALVAGPIYDAWLHALFLGFVFSMIFAHALIILPAITGMSLPFSRFFYLPPLLLQFSLILRITADLLLLPRLRLWGGLLNALAIVLFAVFVIVRLINQKVRSHG